MPGAAYDPYNVTQNRFLSALSLGEAPGGLGGLFIGTGGTDLSDAPTDQYGFPQWGGFGNSHAAGWFQFQPGTWEDYAKPYNLNFRNPDDQKAAAWYLAQDTYKLKTGRDLSAALEAGDYQSVQNSLVDVWPSVTGNKAAPGGLAASLAQGRGNEIGTTGTISPNTTPFPGNLMTALMPSAAGGFARIGLLIVGSVIILIALWALLSQTGVVPGPEKVFKTTKGLATTAAAALV